MLFYILFNINNNLKNEKDEKKLSSEMLKIWKIYDFEYEKEILITQIYYK